ncbi:cation diffusion facilitator family transporter [Methylobacterium nigriterrae]|uniref:cation diffusion facilitator family transporter n=1 Tax=Methylobacterium nigriterrae TaxID=3127512 RepID=UPI0030141807
MNQSGSKFVVYAALAGNLAIAASKLAAATFTGSSAMFTEAIHSLVDTGNQGLILYGLRRAARPADETHPFGHGLELYFWSFVVALLIFAFGGAFAIYEGVEKIRHPQPIDSAWVNVVVIAVSIVFEGLSFGVARREMRARFTGIPLWTAMRRSKDPSTFAVLLEDGAALAGLVIALGGVAVSGYLGEPRADGIASVGIGALLIGTAFVLGRETRSLLTGESASPALLDRAREIIAADPCVVRIDDLRSLQLGPACVLLAVTLDISRDLTADEQRGTITNLRATVQAGLPVVAHLYLRLAEQVPAGTHREKAAAA